MAKIEAARYYDKEDGQMADSERDAWVVTDNNGSLLVCEAERPGEFCILAGRDATPELLAKLAEFSETREYTEIVIEVAKFVAEDLAKYLIGF